MEYNKPNTRNRDSKNHKKKIQTQKPTYSHIQESHKNTKLEAKYVHKEPVGLKK